MQRKRVAVRLFLIILAATGCRPARPTEAPPPHKGVRVTVLCPDDRARALVETASRGWQARQQATVAVVREGPADVVVLPAAGLGRAAAAGELLPLPAALRDDRDFNWEGLLPLYREHLMAWGRDDARRPEAYALPLLGEAPLLVWRSDRLKDEKLAPPATWADFEQVALHFAKKDGRPSLPPLPVDDAELEKGYYGVAAGFVRRARAHNEAVDPGRYEEVFAFHFDLSGRPRIASPGFVHALALLRRLGACRPAAPGDPAEAFRKGDAVLALLDASALPALQAAGSPVRDRFEVGPLPGGDCYFRLDGGRQEVGRPNRVPYLGAGALLGAVPRAAEHAEAAFALLADLSGPDVSKQVVFSPHARPRWGGGPLRAEQLDAGTRWEGFDLDAERTRQLREALEQTLLASDNPALCLRVPEEARYAASLRPLLRKALAEGGPEAKAALDEAEKAWAAIADTKPPAVRAAEYRLSVGLEPR
jgi:ABC-type glycerol-3-phosphate transport system substrate-binding protein